MSGTTTGGLAQGRVNPARDAARAAKRQRLTTRGVVSKDVEFHVFHDGAEWTVTVDGILEIIGRGTTPVSAVIAAELALFQRAR